MPGLLQVQTNQGRPTLAQQAGLITSSKRRHPEGSACRALRALLVLPERSRALLRLRALASSRDSTAFDAVYLLIEDSEGFGWSESLNSAQRSESVAVLRELSRQHKVVDELAQSVLGSWVGAHPKP